MLKRFVTAAAFLMTIATTVHGQTTNWTGGAFPDSSWSNSGNWDNGVPVAGGVATFGGGFSVAIDQAAIVGSIQANTSVGTVSFTGNNTLTIDVNSGFGNSYIDAQSSSVQFGAGVTLALTQTATANISVGVGNTVTIDGSVMAAGGVNLTGPGNTVLNGDYTNNVAGSGATTLLTAQAGGLTLGSGITVDANVVINGTSTLHVNSGTATISRDLSFTGNSGGAATVLGAGNNGSGTIAVNGDVNFGADNTFNVAAAGFDPANGARSYTLMSVSGDLTIDGFNGGMPFGDGVIAQYTYDESTTSFNHTSGLSGFLTGLEAFTGGAFATGDTFTLSKSGGNLVLEYAPVPEPGTMLAIGAAVLGAGAALRRRFGRKAATTAEAEIV